jgi:hypothetical protein
MNWVLSKPDFGHAIAQVDSRQLPTMAAQVWSQVRSCGICGGQRGTGAGSLRVLWFPLPILIPTTPPSSSIIWGWYNRPNTGQCTKWIQPHPTPRNLKKNKKLSQSFVSWSAVTWHNIYVRISDMRESQVYKILEIAVSDSFLWNKNTYKKYRGKMVCSVASQGTKG